MRTSVSFMRKLNKNAWNFCSLHRRVLLAICGERQWYWVGFSHLYLYMLWRSNPGTHYGVFITESSCRNCCQLYAYLRLEQVNDWQLIKTTINYKSSRYCTNQCCTFKHYTIASPPPQASATVVGWCKRSERVAKPNERYSLFETLTIVSCVYRCEVKSRSCWRCLNFVYW